MVEAGKQVLWARDVRYMNYLRENTQHLHLTQHILAACSAQDQQLPALTSSSSSRSMKYSFHHVVTVTSRLYISHTAKHKNKRYYELSVWNSQMRQSGSVVELFFVTRLSPHHCSLRVKSHSSLPQLDYLASDCH